MRTERIASVISVLIITAIVVWAVMNLPGIDNTSDVKTEHANIPAYSGEAVIELNGNKPEFTEDEIKSEFFETYSELDSLGRCGVAFACLDEEHMPFGERESIGMVKPTGWQIDKYDFIDNGGFIYNRCHLIGWQLTGQNEEEKNLITGTRIMNTEGMLPYENRVASYLRTSGEHVMYRVTPVFYGKEMLSRGVQIEAYSVEDDGVGLSFNVFCYNVQPGVEINYANGENHLQ